MQVVLLGLKVDTEQEYGGYHFGEEAYFLERAQRKKNEFWSIPSVALVLCPPVHGPHSAVLKDVGTPGAAG